MEAEDRRNGPRAPPRKWESPVRRRRQLYGRFLAVTSPD